MPKTEKVAEAVLRPDLEAGRRSRIEAAAADDERARREAPDFLADADSQGRCAVSQALRHFFVTPVSRTGAHLETSQDLARHCAPIPTARYTRSGAEDRIEAVRALPDPGAGLAADRATDSAPYSSERGAPERNSVRLGAVGAETAELSGCPKCRLPLTLALDSANNRPRRGAGAAERAGFENR